MLQKPTILNIKTVAKSTIFEIQSVDLKFANGTHRTYERFRPGKYASVMVVAIDGDDMLLVREYAMGTERSALMNVFVPVNMPRGWWWRSMATICC